MKERFGHGGARAIAGLGLAMGVVLAAALAGCGGSDSGSAGADSIAPPGAEQIAAAPCARCRSGFVAGVAADGGAAIVGAEVQLSDSAGRVRAGTTDANGRFELPLGELSGALLVRVTGSVAGAPTRLHGALRLGEAGRQYAAVTLLSELIVAEALGGVPDSLAREGRLDFNRLAGDALPQAAQRVRARLAPLLDAAGVAADLDLRIALFDAPARAALAGAPATLAPGFARALAWLQVQPGPASYGVRHAAMPADAALRFDPAGGDGGAALPALSADDRARLAAAFDGLAGVDARLAALGAAFATGLPDAAALEGHLGSTFLHRGLDRGSYVERVLRRADAADMGAFSLVGSAWGGAVLLAVETAQAGAAPMPIPLRLRVGWAVAPRAPFSARHESAWFERDAAGQWLMRGDGAAPAAQLAWALSLGPQPLSAAELRARQGVVCDVLTAAPLHEQCVAASVGGQLDFGSAQDARFGLLGLYRTAQGDALQRRAEFARQSVLLATPSARVQLLLALAVDAREIDPRAVQVRVRAAADASAGSGLVWTLYRPASEAGAPRFTHWSLDPAGQEDWHAVEPGRCEGTPLADAAAAVCAQAWSQAQALPAWRLQVLDAGGALLHEGPVALARSAPSAQAAWAARERVFARWALGTLADRQPTVGRINAAAAAPPAAGIGDALWLDWPWAAAGDTTTVPRFVYLEWQRADPAAAQAIETVRRALPLAGAGTPWALAVPARAGYVGTWLSARLEATDALGTRLWHTVSPANPY